MKCKKKIFVIIVVVLLSSSFVIIPTINAGSISSKFFKKLEPLKSENNSYDLLIITPGEYHSILVPLKTHKEKYDVTTKIVTLNEVYEQEYWGRDNAEKIKFFIKDSFDKWGIKYVMFVGNFRRIPVRYVYNDENWSGYPEPYFISELYYADLYDSEGNYSSWNKNNNDKFGEWKGPYAQDGDIDLRPDVYVGRLACRNKIEVKIMVEKIITYETTTYGKDWFKKFVVIAGDTYPKEEFPAYEGEENCKLAMENMTGFEFVELFTSTGNFTGPEDVLNAFKDGCGFVAFDGHASPQSWSTHPPNEKTWVNGLSTSTMTKLKNKNKYPIVIAGACHNAQFDVSIEYMIEGIKEQGLKYFSRSGKFAHNTWIPECWSWKLTRKIGGGSIATIANTGLGMSKEDKESLEGAGDYMDLQFFYEYGTNDTEILGEAWGKAIDRYLDAFPIDWNTRSSWDYAYDAKTVQQWVLLGDPSLKIGGYPPII